MGLDMYLYLSKYEDDIANKVEHFYPQELNVFEKAQRRHNFVSKSTSYQVGYWRKDNAIHNFFVEECADGIDNCQRIYVSIDKIEELKELCEKVLKDHSLAPELLPTCEGFFFGGTEYDEWYFDGLKYTVELLDNVLKVVKEQEEKHNYYDIYYQASW